MIKKDEALKLALEAAYLAGFNDSAEGYNGEYPFRDYGGTPTKDRLWVFRRDEYIREALADQPAQQQEPVARPCHVFNVHKNGALTEWEPTTMAFALPDGTHALYTSPPASKPWVGLTDVEWMNIVNKDHAWFGQRPEDVAHEVAKLVEAKLREKNAS